MKKYTANYTFTNPNFVFQNLDGIEIKTPIYPLLCIVKNLLQRGFPTAMSKFLQEKIGEIQNLDNYSQRLLLVSPVAPTWHGTIKGDVNNNYFPARDFLERIIPNEMGEYGFIQSMLIPEIGINDIVGKYNASFDNQAIDFYLPQARLVIEIDGQQHKTLDPQRVSDLKRDAYLLGFQIRTIRITTDELRNGTYRHKLAKIREIIDENHALFEFYKVAFDKARANSFTEEDIQTKLIPTAVIRFELFFIDLLIQGRIQTGHAWKFNICCDEPLANFAELAIEDVYIWLSKLYLLRYKEELPKFDYSINCVDSSHFRYDTEAINIDFSLFKRYTDEHKIAPVKYYIRTDYFDYSAKNTLRGRDKNYFKVSTDESINYNITDRDKPVLRFFLQNLFNKKDFREGQFPIIANALNLRDTIGLLPTGGGKSLCYQLPCLLQPSVNFVVCPIKSLMFDQADNLHKGDVAITNINYICSDQSAAEKAEVLENYSNGKYLFVWISPERFQMQTFRDSIKAIVHSFNISYAVIDEVHCLSEWGHDFRTSYLNLAKTIDALSPRDQYNEGKIKYIGLTATASVNVLKDIKVEFSRRKQQLEEENIKTLLDYSRKELVFKVVNDEGNKWTELLKIFEEENIPNDPSKATLIFTPFVNSSKGCFQLCNNIDREFPGKVAFFSGSIPKNPTSNEPLMSREEFDRYKVDIQNKFKQDQYPILCATKAFGMGIDKQNIFTTIHFGLPSSIEALYQEAGRAGRWDKSLRENRGKEGHCYVLHSHERKQHEAEFNRFFSNSIPIEELAKISKDVGLEGRDVFTQVFLMMRGLTPIESEFESIKLILEEFFEPNIEKTIFYDDFLGHGINEEKFEKEIYRLCILGIVEDWTQDFVNSFVVKFRDNAPEHILDSLKSYINKYDPDEDIETAINSVTSEACSTFLDQAIWYLLEWVFKHITENRKQSLKTLSDWCSQFESSEQFKQRIDSYFTFNESSFILQHIAEHSYDISTWFEAFYSNNQVISVAEFMRLRDRMSRFLEGYHNSPGLNFVSGFIRLKLNEYDDPDGRERLEKALLYLSEKQAQGTDIEVFFERLIDLVKLADFNDSQNQEIGLAIINYFPEQSERLADQLNMPYLCNTLIENQIQNIKQLNATLYAALRSI